jgi:hypothetical protein
MKPYLRCGDDGSEEINAAALEVVATQKLCDNWEFDPEVFLRNVRDVSARIATEEQPRWRNVAMGTSDSRKRWTEMTDD